jgi:hypothetical protein
MTRIYLVVLFAFIASCSPKIEDTGAYGTSFMPIVSNLRPTKTVALYTSTTESRRAELMTYFTAKIRNEGWKQVGTACVFGSEYDVEQIKTLARLHGADTVLLHIGPTPRLTRKVAYGYGGSYNPSYNYYGNPYGQIIPPYQVAPPQGDLMGSMLDFSLKRQQHERNEQILQGYRDQRTAQIRAEQMKWTQWLHFLRSPTN